MANIPWLMAVLGHYTTSLTNGTLVIHYNPPRCLTAAINWLTT